MSSALLSAPAPVAAASARQSLAVRCKLDLVARHGATPNLSVVTGWMTVENEDWNIAGLGIRLADGSVVRARYPFFREEADKLAGFAVLLPARLEFAPLSLEFVLWLAAEEGETRVAVLNVALQTREVQTGSITLSAPGTAAPAVLPISDRETSDLLEERLVDHLARRRHLTLRLDLINKCNLRCVMCHYADEGISKRPAQRVSPEQFADWFEPLAPITRDVVLSCGDEPLMSPHFDTIVRSIAARDPEVRIRFCTNGMLMSEKISEAIIAARVYLMMFSFDGVTSGTLHRIRVGSDYHRIVKNILGLKRARARSGRANPKFVFNFVMMESNVHEGPNFVRMAKRLGGDYIDFRLVVPMLDIGDIAHEMLDNHQPKFNHYRALIVAEAEACGMEIYIPPPFKTHARHDPAGDPLCQLDEFHALLTSLGEDPLHDDDRAHPAEVAPLTVPHESAQVFCDRPFSEVMIQNQRDVYPCPWHQEKMGTLDGSASLQEIFFNENFRRVRRAMFDPLGAPGCSNCPIKSGKLPTRKT
ncbi:MAG TPA: radical SAM protein [Opitutaceae bacterium]|nr:radical SAM protein [Opitutaceae bacterium]